MKQNRVLVIGRNYSPNLCMARSMGEAGFYVEVLRIHHTTGSRKHILDLLVPHPEAKSRYVSAYHECITERDPEKIFDAVMKLYDQDQKTLLVPTDDLTAGILDEHYRELSGKFLLPDASKKQGGILKLMEKGYQKKLAEEAGIPVVRGTVISYEKGKVTVPDDLVYPVFLKPNESRLASKSIMKKYEDREALTKALTALSENGSGSVLVEQYVDIKTEYSLLGISIDGRAEAPGFFRTESGAGSVQKGVALLGKMLTEEEMAEKKEIVSRVEHLIGNLQYTGLFDVDLLETRDGKLYFVELNLRYGASGYAVTRSGANLPGMFASYMFDGKEPETAIHLKEYGKVFVNENVLLDAYTAGALTMHEIEAYRKQAEITFIENEADPAPYRHFRKYFASDTLLRIAKHH